MNDPKRETHPSEVSCIVPVFNGERYLREALDSILGQTHAAAEIIVVDDGSTDATADVIAAYSDRVRCLRQENRGPAAARNRGCGAARGSFVAFLDADDLWDETKLERQIARFCARPELDLCFTYGRNFWIPELREEAAHFEQHRIARPLPVYLPSTLLARRRAFESVGGFDERLRFGHSTEWVLRARSQGVLTEVLPEVLYHRRLHHTNRSRKMSAESRDEFLRLVKAKLDRERERSL